MDFWRGAADHWAWPEARSMPGRTSLHGGGSGRSSSPLGMDGAPRRLRLARWSQRLVITSSWLAGAARLLPHRLVALLCAAAAGGQDLAVAHLELWGVFKEQNMYKVLCANIQLTRRALICKIRGTGRRLIQSIRSGSNGPPWSFQVSIVSWFSLDTFSSLEEE
jgi:hypothetical protein